MGFVKRAYSETTNFFFLLYIKQMAYTKEYYETNREIINLKKRTKYDNTKRKAYYEAHKHDILAAQKVDLQVCPFCNIRYRRCYLQKHIANRHGHEDTCQDVIANINYCSIAK